MRPLRLVLVLAVVAGALSAVPSYAAAPHLACTGSASTASLLQYASGGGTAKALYVLPKDTPKGIVVFDHGYGHTMYSWVRHMQRVARTLGVVAVTPDYRGQVDDLKARPLPSSRGWRVAEGAVDTNAVAQLFDRACLRGKGHNVLYSVSMGGNTAGLALAAQPKRTGGRPLWDEWVDVEGAANVTETYLGAAALASVNEFAAHAKADIEAEMGGTPQQVPEVYADRTVVNRVDDIKASGVKGVVMAHGVGDGLVTHDVSRQLQLRLRALQVPVDMRTFVTHSRTSESGTTLDGYLPTGQPSPFAGHASEASETQDVGVEGFKALTQLYGGYHVLCRDVVTDGSTGLSETVPDGCP
ncbi:MAG: hypothetical protein JWM02_1551 [Frankiales bacterium]|nr:hypothetical protein [Frankiales bacterium]